MIGVYIVDDSVLFVKELVETVPWQDFGCKIVGIAYDADTAENDIRALQPDIVITDICMEKRNGLDMIESLMDLDHIDYILVSGFSRFEYALKAIRLNVADYFVKPFDDEEFYAAIKRLVAKKTTNTTAANTIPGNYKPEDGSYLQKAMQYIDEHYAEDISAESVAMVLYVSESYLGKQFRRNLDTSFNEYLNYIRIQKAKDLLQNTSLKIFEVAEKVGFNNEKYFSMVFRKLIGITPREYKKTL